jgi:hypothetical protein
MTQPQTVHLETVELVAVNGQVSQPGVLPRKVLVDLYSDQMRHHVGQTMVVVPFDPDYLDLTFGIGKFADVTQEAPVLFSETAEVQVREDIAQKNQSPKRILLEHAGGIVRAAAVRAEMHVGEDQRVVDGRIHTSVLAKECYGVMKIAQKIVQPASPR